MTPRYLTITLISALISAALLLPTLGFADAALLTPCPASTHSKILDYEDKALCARVAVAEANQINSRSITLNVVVLPATTRAKVADPLVLLAGGPGQSVVSVGPAWAGRFENLRKDRDFLLIDQRGTGDSNSLACAEALAPIFDEGDLDGDVNLVLSQQITALKDCLTTLDADPRFYTTIDAAADLEAVRLRLGYPAMNLFGVSYGTRIALVFNRLYPDAVRSLLLDAVAPVDMLIPAQVGLDADLAFERITAECDQTPT
jgi:pimeloyl-ACP methyl ester carboxylesterase